jgi:hypothetical protein
MQVHRLATFPVLIAALVLAGCASVTPIGELLDDAGRYDGETVQVEGEARGGVGALGVGAYQVDDGTGTLTVLSDQSTPPRDGARVRVKGVFEALFTLGPESLAVLREESRSRP